jgi:hypothetical protein
VRQNHRLRVILCGANPGVRLFDGDTVTAYASVWVSTGPSGAAGLRPPLPEAAGLAWPEPEKATVDVRLDFAHELTAQAADVKVTMSGILDRRAFQTDEFGLDGVPHGLRLVSAPVSEATIHIGGQRVPGTVTTGGPSQRPTSSAFLTTAEVWLR